VRTTFHQFPMIPALKHAVAHWRRDDEWKRVRPPLVELTAEQSAALVSRLDSLGFALTGV
jgi:4-hydroxy-tetrahydrodipicolinate synthase